MQILKTGQEYQQLCNCYHQLVIRTVQKYSRELHLFSKETRISCIKCSPLAISVKLRIDSSYSGFLQKNLLHPFIVKICVYTVFLTTRQSKNFVSVSSVSFRFPTSLRPSVCLRLSLSYLTHLCTSNTPPPPKQHKRYHNPGCRLASYCTSSVDLAFLIAPNTANHQLVWSVCLSINEGLQLLNWEGNKKDRW